MPSKDDVYEQRNLTAIAFASMVADVYGERGAGWYNDRERPGTGPWPVVFLETEYGQIGWHVPPEREELLARTPIPNRKPSDGYDGHGNDDRLERLKKLADR